jgi:hypothetical protein
MKKLVPRPFWLIVKGEAGLLDVLRTNLATGEEALPVFSFEDEAGMFLELGALDGWRVRITTAGELISVLFGPCAGVRRVVLDPLPGQDVTAWNGLLSMEREAFMRFAANQGYGRYGSAARSTGSGNRVGQRSPDRVGSKHGRARRPGQSMTDARQAGVIVPTAMSTRR